MRVTGKMMVQNFMRTLNSNLSKVNTHNQKLASGKRINSPSDDPVGTATSMQFNSTLAGTSQYIRNIEYGRAWMTTTEDALSRAGDILQRARELAVYGLNDTLDDSDRAAVADELRELREGLLELSGTTHAGRYVFSGQKTREPPFLIVDRFAAEIAEDAEELTSAAVTFANGELGTVGDAIADGATVSVVDTEWVEAAFAGGELETIDISFAAAEAGSQGNDYTIEFTVNEAIEADEALVGVEGDRITVEIDSSQTTIQTVLDAINDHEEAGAMIAATTGDDDPEETTISATDLAGDGTETVHMTGGRDAGYEVELASDQEGIENDTFFVAEGEETLEVDEGEFEGLLVNSENWEEAEGDIFLSILSGRPGEAIFQGDSGEQQLELSHNSTMNINIDGEQAFGEAFEVLEALASEFAGADEEMSDDHLSKFDDILDRILSLRSDIGARINRIELTENRLQDSEINLRRLLSETEDVDLAETIMEMRMSESVYRASLATGARILQPTLVDFLR